MFSRSIVRTSSAVALGLALVAVLIVAGNRQGRGSRTTAFSSEGRELSYSLSAPTAQFDAAPSARVAAPRIVHKDLAEENEDQRPRGALPFDRQKLIWTGCVSLEVEHAGRAMADLQKVALDLGGYVTGTEMNLEASGVRRGEVILRIPAEQYTRARESLHGLGRILSERSNVEDVTKAYSDLEAHLGVKRETERRVRDLLAHRTGNLKDVLEAEKELARIRGEIDTMEGERRWYEHQVRYSTVTVRLQEPAPIGLSRPSAWASLGDALRDSAGSLADSMAVLFRGLVYLFPWGLLGLLVFMGIRRFRRVQRPQEDVLS